MEMLDVTDASGTAELGAVSRAGAHQRGLWHRCFHLWVVSGDGVLLQRRSRGKGSWPGRLDATAAGHLTAGERVLDGLREAEEELGAVYAASQLTDLGVYPIDEPRPAGGRNREHQHVFAVRDDRPLTAWTDLQAAELDGLVHVRHAAFARLTAGDAVEGVEWDLATRRAADVRLDPAELVPSPYLHGLAAPLASLDTVSPR